MLRKRVRQDAVTGREPAVPENSALGHLGYFFFKKKPARRPGLGPARGTWDLGPQQGLWRATSHLEASAASISMRAGGLHHIPSPPGG